MTKCGVSILYFEIRHFLFVIRYSSYPPFAVCLNSWDLSSAAETPMFNRVGNALAFSRPATRGAMPGG